MCLNQIQWHDALWILDETSSRRNYMDKIDIIHFECYQSNCTVATILENGTIWFFLRPVFIFSFYIDLSKTILSFHS
jgi:hypothetical protein